MKRLAIHSVLGAVLFFVSGAVVALAAQGPESRPGIWISPAEVMALPDNGPAWDALLAQSRKPISPDLSDKDDPSNVRVLARALVATRTGSVQARQEVLNRLETFPLQLQEATLERVLAAARLKARCALSHADAFAVALAQELGAPVATGDREFEQVESLVDVLWL